MASAYYQLDYPESGSHQQQFRWLGLGELAERLTFVHENLFLTQPDFAGQCQLLTRAYRETNRVPVVCMDTNPFDHVEQLAIDLQQAIDTPFFILGCDARPDTYTHNSVGYWPFWLINQQQQSNLQNNTEPQHRISFLSGIAKNHRLQLFAQIRPWITDQDVVVVNRLNTVNIVDPQFESILTTLPWSNNASYIDIPHNSTYIHQFSQNSHAAYNACVNITAETVSYNIESDHNYDSLHFITEKTWKAYRSGCLVINYPIDTLPDTLAHYGIRIWKEYDACAAVDEKINVIVDLFQRTDIFEIYQSQSADICYNQQLVGDSNWARSIAQSTINQLTSLCTRQ